MDSTTYMQIKSCFLVLCFFAAFAVQLATAQTPQKAISVEALQTIDLQVRETAGVARVDELVEGGIPLSASLNLTSTDVLGVEDAQGNAVAATFHVLARWNAGLSSAAPIQWLLVRFRASIAANQSATFHLKVYADSNFEHAQAVDELQLTQNGNEILVNTGAASFAFGRNANALFDEIRDASNSLLAQGGSLSIETEAGTFNVNQIRSLRIERQDALSAVVLLDNQYDMAPLGGGLVSSQIRYEFRAGSPTALVRHVIKWEGDLCPGDGWDTSCDVDSDGNAEPNGLKLNRIRDSLSLSLSAPVSATILGAYSQPAVSTVVADGNSAMLRQNQRNQRSDPLSYVAQLGAQTLQSGSKADGGLLMASNSSASLAVAFRQMERFEPQALILQNGSALQIDVAAQHIWLGQRQGLYANFAVSALPAAQQRSDYERFVWAPLNHPLRPWPGVAQFSRSHAVDELPVGELPSDLSSYDGLIEGVLSSTMELEESKGLWGLTTYGLFPRYWGSVITGDELDCADSEPTPAESWDNSYWCATWTDYHNTSAAAAYYAMRSGKVEWLDDVTWPAAQRQLYTQVIQCSPSDDYFYCGQAPSGYGGYRVDFNSSHAYFSNLFLYYWLTGDSTVLERLQRGASSMRTYLCARRPQGACLAEDAPTDEWGQLTGRMAYQWHSVFRFLGLASADASYLEDYRSGLSRALTQYYAELQANNKTYGFWLGSTLASAASYNTDQLWMASLYDMDLLYRASQDWNDEPIGNPAVAPSRALISWARTLLDYGSKVLGNGTASSTWPNQLLFEFSGARLGGALLNVGAYAGGDDLYLYDTGKAALSAVVARAAYLASDPEMRSLAYDLAKNTLRASAADASPLGKIQGEYLSKLPATLALLELSEATPVPTVAPSPTVQPTSTAQPTPTQIAPRSVAIAASGANAYVRGRRAGEFTIYRGIPYSRAIKVSYRIGGSATNGRNYKKIRSSAVMPAKARSVKIKIVPLSLSPGSISRSVRLTLLSASHGFKIAGRKSAQVVIRP